MKCIAHVRGRSRSLLNVEAVLNSVSFAAPTGKEPASRKADCGLIDFSGKERIIRQHLRTFCLSFAMNNRAFFAETLLPRKLEHCIHNHIHIFLLLFFI